MSVTLRARLRSYGLPLLVLILTWAAMSWTTPRFRGSSSLFAVVDSFALVGLVALGLAITIIAGELDLSVGSMAALAAVIAVRVADYGLIPAIVAAVIICLLIGLAQGLIIAMTGINSLVLTIGTLILLRGVTYLGAGNAPLPLTDFTVSDPLLVRYWVFSIGTIVAVLVFVLVGLFLAYTKQGRQIYAIGGAREEAVAAGVSRLLPITLSFGISASCAALAGAFASIRGGSAAPANYEELLLVAAAAALLGGVSLYGGRGTVANVTIGAAILAVITAGLAARGSGAAVVQLTTGGLLLFVVSLEFAADRMKNRRPEPHAVAAEP